jgi:uncharacterized cupredoxin-like copper-binding protein
VVVGRALLATAVVGVLGSLAACGSGSGPSQATETVVIDIEHSAFEPTALEFEAGTQVTFVIRNTDPIDHEFILGDEEVQQIHEKGTEAHHGAKPGEISVPAGEERETSYLFEDEGQLIYGCHLPGHYDYGMKGIVRVT